VLVDKGVVCASWESSWDSKELIPSEDDEGELKEEEGV
jgi:hypothetical protein